MDNIVSYIQEKLVINKNTKINKYTFKLNNKHYKNVTVALPFNIYLPEEDETVSICSVKDGISKLTGDNVYRLYDKKNKLVVKLSQTFGIYNLFFPRPSEKISPRIFQLNDKILDKRTEIELETNNCIIDYEENK